MRRLLPLYPRLLRHHGADAHGGACRFSADSDAAASVQSLPSSRVTGACRSSGTGLSMQHALMQRPGSTFLQAALSRGSLQILRRTDCGPDSANLRRARPHASAIICYAAGPAYQRATHSPLDAILSAGSETSSSPKGRASSGVFLYAGSTCRTKSYSRYTMSPCATPAAPSGRPPRARSVNCSGSRLVSWFRGQRAVWVSVGRDAPGCTPPCLHVTGCAQQPASKVQPWDGCACHRCAMARRDGEEDEACSACYKTGVSTWNECCFTWASAHQLGVL